MTWTLTCSAASNHQHHHHHHEGYENDPVSEQAREYPQNPLLRSPDDAYSDQMTRPEIAPSVQSGGWEIWDLKSIARCHSQRSPPRRFCLD